ncbi:hypothetical protein Gpo141_00004599 [Globisporangium polare]
MPRAALTAVLSLLLVAAPALVAASCCDVCLAQTDPAHSEITYDPIVFNQCSAAKGICCYGCDFSHGSITYQDGVTFDATSGLPIATAGTRIHFTYNSIARVTYDFLRANQKKTSFVGNQSSSADVEGSSGSGKFSICVSSAGTIALRGWGSNSCSQVTTETTITVNAAASGASTTCSAAGTVKPADTSSSTSGSGKGNQAVNSLGSGTGDSSSSTNTKTGKYDTANCNLNRGAVTKTSDGTAICDCAGDWRNPPACDEYSWTKTILTIAGAFATLLSIVISVRAYVKSRNAKAAADGATEDVVDIDDRMSGEVLRLDRRSPSKLPTPSSTRTSTSTAASGVMRSPARSPGDVPVKAVRETTL